MRTWWIRKVLGFLAIAAVAVLGLGWIVMMLWNAILPDILHTPLITYWQAVGLLVLTHILFRGVGHFGRRHHKSHHYWKYRFEQKLASMTPEEREKFREEYKRRCGWDPGEDKQTEHHQD